MKKRVLVVEDDRSVRESLKKVLLQAGYAVDLAADALEAARYEPGQFDLMLLEIQLFAGTGCDVLQTIARRNPLLPLVVITRLPLAQNTGVVAEVSAVFEKPVEVPQLLKTIEDLLARSAAQRSGVEQGNSLIQRAAASCALQAGNSIHHS